MMPFGEHLPDQAPYGNVGSNRALNAIPYGRHYLPFPGLNPYTNALDSRALILTSFRDTASAVAAYAGDSGKLYSLSGSTWVDASKAGGYAVPERERWRDAAYGDRMLMACSSTKIQSSASGGQFADLSDEAPQAAHIGVVREFVMAGGISGSPRLLKWCAFNDPTKWTVGQSQADEQELPDGDEIMAVIGGEVGHVFQRNAFRRATYVGPTPIFQIDKLSDEIGTEAAYSVVAAGNRIFAYTQSGFAMIQGGQATPIGEGRVDETFWKTVDRARLHEVQGEINSEATCVYWLYPSKASALPDRMLVYNWLANQWADVEVMAECLGRFGTPALGPDDPQFATLSPDDPQFATLSPDDSQFAGGSQEIGAFSTSHTAGFFDGPMLQATFESGEQRILPQSTKKALVTGVATFVDGGGASVEVGLREKQSDPVEWVQCGARTDQGMHPVFREARYFRTRVHTQGFDKAQGYQLLVQPAGDL